METADTDTARADASRDDFRIDDLMTADQAVQRFTIFRRSELLAAMRVGELRHWRKGRKRFVTERWLRDWIRPQLRGGDSDAGRKEPAIDPEDRRGWGELSSRTMTPEEEETQAKFLCEAIMRRPRRPSRQ